MHCHYVKQQIKYEQGNENLIQCRKINSNFKKHLIIINSLNKYLWSTYYVLSIGLRVEDITINNQIVPALMLLRVQWEKQTVTTQEFNVCCIRCFWVVWRRNKGRLRECSCWGGRPASFYRMVREGLPMKSSLQEVKKWAMWMSGVTAFLAEGSVGTKRRQVLYPIVLYHTSFIYFSTQQWFYIVQHTILLTLFHSVKDCKLFLNIATDSSQTLYDCFSMLRLV